MIADEALVAIARGAEGGMRDAESTLDQLIAFCGNKIAESDVLNVFGLVAHDKIASVTDALIDGNTNVALRAVKELDEVGKDLQRLLADLLDHFRNLLVLTLDGEQLVDVADTQMDLLKAQAGRIDSDAVLRIIDALAAAEGRLRYALSKRIYFEIALVRAIKARQMIGLDGVLKKLNELKGQTAAGKSDMPVATGSAPDSGTLAPPAPPVSSLDDAWAYAVDHLNKVNPLAKSYLVGAKPLGLKAGVMTIGLDPEFPERREFVDTTRNKEVLQSKLHEKLHAAVALKFELSESITPATMARPPIRQPVQAKAPVPEPPRRAGSMEEFKNDPLIKKALEIFKGQIVEVRK
jgi:DNA polymerase-3 subunit gamma/tau